jgi:putative ABC transport system permease protein
LLPRALVRTGLRDLLRRPLHTSLMIAGVALGVAVVIAVDLANESARRGFARSTEAVVGRATHRIEAGPSGVPEALLARLRRDWGLRLSAPIVEGSAVTAGPERRPLHILGVDPLSEAPFRSGLGSDLVGEGGLPGLFTGPGAVLDATTAGHLGLELGDPLSLRIEGRLEQIRLVGLVASEDGAAGELVLMDVGRAQALLGRPGRLTRIDLILGEHEARALRDRLPPGTVLTEAGAQADAVGQLTQAFQLNLTALSLLALVVGMFLIYNTVMFRVVQRRRVIGTLRALGATPGQVFGMVVIETAVAAAFGTALGLGLGWLLGQGVVLLVTRTINDLYYVLAVTGAPLTLSGAIKAALLGLGAGVLSALPPAWEASQVQPVTAMRGSTLEEASRRWLPRLAALGLVLLAAGGVTMAVLTRSLTASFGALFMVVLGIAAMVPLATVGLMLVVAGPARGIAGITGRLAARTVTRAVSRTGVAIAALMVAVSVTIGVSVMIESFRGTVANWLDLTLRADVYVSTPGPGPRGRLAPRTLAPDVAGLVAAIPGVAEVETYRAVRVASEHGEINLGASDARRARSAALYRFADGDAAETWKRVEQGAVVISEPFLHRHRLPQRGAEIEITTDRGPHRFPVVGVFYDYTTEEGTVLMSRAVYDRHWNDPGVTSVAAWAEPGVAAGVLAERVRETLSGRPLAVVANRVLRARALRVFDRTFAVTQALRLLAVVVAFIGVWSALMALQVERTRELATLRAVGMTPGQLGGLTLVETGLMGLSAGLLSLPTGILLAVILIDVINVRSFGWSMELELRPAVLVQAVAVSVAAALLAAAYPLHRLRRLPLAAALRQE